jgi:hypothetical protein
VTARVSYFRLLSQIYLRVPPRLRLGRSPSRPAARHRCVTRTPLGSRPAPRRESAVSPSWKWLDESAPQSSRVRRAVTRTPLGSRAGRPCTLHGGSRRVERGFERGFDEKRCRTRPGRTRPRPAVLAGHGDHAHSTVECGVCVGNTLAEYF